MHRRGSATEPEATTATAIARTHSLPASNGDVNDGKRRWLRRESFADRFKSKFNRKKEEPARARSQSLSSPSTESVPMKSDGIDSKLSPSPPPAAKSLAPPAPVPSTDPKIGRIPKRVGFAQSVLYSDPPQQIPPSNPRKGGIEIVNGEVRTPTYRSQDMSDFSYIDPTHSTVSLCAAKRAHENASRLHSSLTKGSFLGLFKDDEEETTAPVVKVDTEQPSAVHYSSDHESGDESDPEIEENSNPETIYTRCCHLREILPIKSMLKQLHNQVAPIPELHIVNVKPTTIELLAFTDFLRIIPVVWVRMDSLVLRPDMIRILLSSLATSTHLTKLSFSSTVLGPETWAYLCRFLENGQKLLSLDISCGLENSRVEPFNRKDVDWSLLAQSLAKCKSIDSLVLSGTQIPLENWQYLMRKGFTKGRSLVMANNSLSREYLIKIVDWLCEPDCQCLGLDIGGNDLSESYDLLKRILYTSKLQRLNAANTNLRYNDALASIFSAEMARQSPLKSLELSCNKNIFPDILEHIVAILPSFVNLRRIELNNCGLTSAHVITLCQAFVRCKSLAQISLLGNGELNETAAAALCVVAHTLPSVVQIDVETAHWKDSFRHQLTSYCIRNMDNIGKHVEDGEEPNEMFSFEQELEKLKEDLGAVGEQHQVPQHVLDKIVNMRNNTRQKLADLLQKRQSQKLTVQEQETMFKLFFYDSSIDRVIGQIKQGLATRHKSSPHSDQADHHLDTQHHHQHHLTAPEPAHEDVYTFDTPRSSLSRAGSSSSLISLKQIEEEEGTFHKLNTWLMGKNNSSPEETEDGLSRDTLQHFLEKDEADLSDATIQKMKSYTAKDLAREINSKASI